MIILYIIYYIIYMTQMDKSGSFFPEKGLFLYLFAPILGILAPKSATWAGFLTIKKPVHPFTGWQLPPGSLPGRKNGSRETGCRTPEGTIEAT